MASEARRGCGYRKAGGIYVRGELGAGIPVGWLPCCIDYPHTLGMVWAEPQRLFRTAGQAGDSWEALLALEHWRRKEKVGLIWVGAQHYTMDSFTKEALEMGISRRVATLPVDVKRGDPVALAFVAAVPVTESGTLFGYEGAPAAMHCETCAGVPVAKAVANAMAEMGRPFQLEAQRQRDVADILAGKERKGGPRKLAMKLRTSGDPMHVAGIFHCFTVSCIEVVLPASIAADPEIQRRCEERDVHIVAVPDNDKDHVPQGWKLPAFLRADDDGAANEPAGEGDGDAPLADQTTTEEQ
jgi:hypothetical protein